MAESRQEKWERLLAPVSSDPRLLSLLLVAVGRESLEADEKNPKGSKAKAYSDAWLALEQLSLKARRK